MSFGFSLSDIVFSCQLALDLHYRCFTKAQRADTRYLQFGQDIKSLGSSLSRLTQIITNANGLRPQKSGQREDDDIAAGVVSTLSDITGDFKQTLLDCNVLLKDNSRFKRSAANFVDNVVWHTATERDVNNLRKRLRFHVMKVNFSAKPFEIQLLSSIRREMQQLRKEVAALSPARTSCPIRSHPQESYFHVPEELSGRFRKALAGKNPALSPARDSLPLKEGFDALVYHYARSTVNFEPSPELGQDDLEKKYLNLVKSRWIIDRLKQNTDFLSLGPGSLWAECTRELEDKVKDQFLRFQQDDLLQPPLDALTQLSDTCFSIWVDEEPSFRPAALTEHRPFEEKILELPLQSLHSTNPSTLTVFRKSDTALRLVSATKDDQNDHFLLQESMDVNMVQTGLVPVFAASQETSTANNNVLLCNQGQDTKSYNLRDPADVAQFQRALTGYRVSHDMSNIWWHIEFDCISKSGISGKARLQLWHLKPLPKIQPPQDTEPAERSSSSSGSLPHSPADSLSSRRFWTSGTTLPASSVVSPVNGFPATGIALTSPEPPILVIFTMWGDKYTFLHLQLDKSVKLELQKCESCRKQKTECSRILIRSTPKKLTSKFIIRRLCAQQKNGQDLGSWNLGCFRYPEHPGFKDLEILSAKYLSLHFDTLDKRDEFCKEFELLENLRNSDLNDYERTLTETKYRSNNPRSY